MKKDVTKILRSAKFALAGLRHAYQGDKSFRMEIQYGFPIFLFVGYLLAPFQSWELLLYVFSYVLILLVELINTAFEKMLDRLHPEQHELIGKSKDIAAGAVALAYFFALITLVVLCSDRFFAETLLISHTFVFDTYGRLA